MTVCPWIGDGVIVGVGDGIAVAMEGKAGRAVGVDTVIGVGYSTGVALGVEVGIGVSKATGSLQIPSLLAIIRCPRSAGFTTKSRIR